MFSRTSLRVTVRIGHKLKVINLHITERLIQGFNLHLVKSRFISSRF
jgi:hypothetical protein